MRRLLWLSALSCAILSTAPVAQADVVRIGRLSQQVSPGRAQIGASVQVVDRGNGNRSVPSAAGAPGSRRSSPAPAIPTLTTRSPLIRDRTPAGPGSFWYQATGGLTCMYVPRAVAPCVRVVSPGNPARPGRRAINPAAIAASAAKRLPLTPGRIEASPSARSAGLTGAASWFWLEGAPSSRSLSVSLRGERVTVRAQPREVQWSFGDGASVRAGPGVPYQPGGPPRESIRHRYQTRCLPGDRGRDPYVLASCRADGYRIEAAVAWGISFRATGPVPGSGDLPSRSTATSIAYPVSEARGFLVGGPPS